MKKIGFIGMGNMAQAMAVGLLRAGKVKREDLYAYAPNQDKLRDNAARIGFNPCASAEEAAANAEIVIMACKPYQLEGVLGRLGGALAGKLIVSVAFGWNFARAKPLLPTDTHYQYIVPNTPVSICSGVLLVEEQNNLTGEEEALLEELLGGLGLYMKLPFAQMGRRKCHVRLRSGVYGDGHRGARRRRREAWINENAGLHAGGLRYGGYREAAAGNRAASGRAQGSGLLAGRRDDSRCCRVGGKRAAQCAAQGY